MQQLELFEDLGKGTYGVVKRVLHKPTKVAMAMKVGISIVSCFTTLTIAAGNSLGTRTR